MPLISGLQLEIFKLNNFCDTNCLALKLGEYVLSYICCTSYGIPTHQQGLKAARSTYQLNQSTG